MRTPPSDDSLLRGRADARASLGHALWVPIGVFFLVSSALFSACGFRIGYVDSLSKFSLILTGIAVSQACARRPNLSAAGIGLQALMQSGVIAIAAMMLIYSAATLNRPRRCRSAAARRRHGISMDGLCAISRHP